MVHDRVLAEFPYRNDYFSRINAVGMAHCRILLSRSGDDVLSRMYASRGYSLDSADDEGRTALTLEIDGRAMGTLSLNVDDGCLSAEHQYPEFVAHLRDRGARICELGKFAMDPAVRSKRAIGALFHMSWILAFRAHGATDIIIEVNPRHAGFYQQALYFEAVGEQRHCARVGAPAVLLHMSNEKVHQLMAQLRGRPSQSQRDHAFMSYCFSAAEEEEILSRWTRMEQDIWPAFMARAVSGTREIRPV